MRCNIPVPGGRPGGSWLCYIVTSLYYYRTLFSVSPRPRRRQSNNTRFTVRIYTLRYSSYIPAIIILYACKTTHAHCTANHADNTNIIYYTIWTVFKKSFSPCFVSLSLSFSLAIPSSGQNDSSAR